MTEHGSRVTPSKRLIVTADDVGLHRGMTDGALHAHESGIVTACSVVANGTAFHHAVERLRDFPKLSAGIHLALVEERPLAADVESLVGASGMFHGSYYEFLPRYFAHRIRIDEVERELRAQIERVLAAGITIAHANGHQHLHLLPRIFTLVQRLAEEYRIPYVRIVDERRRGRGLREASVSVLSRLGRAARARSRVATNDRTIGVTNAGRVAAAADLIALLDDVDGLTELVVHPGLGDSELQEAYDWGYGWEAESRALCDPALRDAIGARGIELVTP
ncbi:MAG TPA: ChbG/HpnK family deacetylase [Thermoanaerobaculia bacterium]